MQKRRIGPAFVPGPAFDVGDAIVVIAIIVALYVGVRLAFQAPAVIRGPEINLSPRALPWYALLSLGRMAAAYLLSLLFSLTYAYAAARSRLGNRVLLPIIDILQSVPILSFLPVVVLSLTALLPERLGIELASILLIFTSQVWNMTFSFYQSLTTVPNDLREAARIFRFNTWLRFKTMELPFGAIPLIWNSMMSWAGGWFFLMAAEIFTLGARDFRLPGLGSYLQTAANQGNITAVLWGLGTLITVIVLMDQFVWRPLLAWADKFKVETVEADEPPQSWFYDLLGRSWLLEQWQEHVIGPLVERLDLAMVRSRAQQAEQPAHNPTRGERLWQGLVIGLVVVGLLYGLIRAIGLLQALSATTWLAILYGAAATFVRVLIAQLISLAWTLPVGVAIGLNRRLAAVLQPIVQIVASIPATALFPVILLFLINLPGGLNIAAILLMLMGTQWYLLFNIIAGASAIPRDLLYTTETLGIRGWDRWRTLILPALFPYLITGMITASGGSWNASIVAEHVEFAGQTHSTLGLGAIIARATAQADYPLLLGATLVMILVVLTINRLFWRRLYAVAEERYKLD